MKMFSKITKFYSNFKFKNIINFFISVIGCFLFIQILSTLFNGYTPINGNESYVWYASLSATLMYFYFGRNKGYFIALLPLLLIFVSPFIIRKFSMLSYDAYDFYRFIGFALCIYHPILAVLSFIKNRFANIFISFICYFVTLLFPSILWGYFFITGKLMLPETFIAILQTNPSEATGYIESMFNIGTYAMIIAFPIIVFILSYFSYVQIFKKSKLPRFYPIFAILLILLHGLLFFHTSRNSMAAPFIQTATYVNKYAEFAENKSIRKANIEKYLQKKDEKGVYVLIIGESQNREHMSVYGYDRDTTPYLNSFKNDPHFIFFDHARSCHCQTVQVLSFALTAKNQYNRIQMKEAPSILEVANAAGYTTAWLSNQGKFGMFNTPITVIASDAKYQDFVNETGGETKREWTEKVEKNKNRRGDYDENLIDSIKKLPKTDKMLIVIHLMGNHAPYTARYPDGYEFYNGRGKHKDTYDNSIRYTDEVLKNIYETIKEIPHFKGVMYFSDHTDAVDQDLEHDATLFVPEMTYIPMFMAFSDDYMKDNTKKFEELLKHKNTYFTNDLVFNTLLSLMNIKLTNIYEDTNDFTSSKYDDDSHRFLTMYGKVEILKDPNFPRK